MKKSQINTELVARYLMNKKDNKTKEMIDKIIHDDENSRREFDEYVNVWEKSADVGEFEKVDPEKDWVKVRSRLNLRGRKKRIPLPSYLVRIAAVLVLALGLAYLLVEVTKLTSGTDTNYIEFVAQNDIRELQLPDGSLVFLNKHAKIIRNNNYGENNRDIILEGEAFFEVTHNKELPFKVHSLNSTIEVVGTSFNVHTDTEQVVVSVVTGKVVFYASENTANRVELERENTGIFEINNEIIIPKRNIDYNQLAWYTGEFKFSSVPLEQVCQTLADYYNLDFASSEGVQFIDSIEGDFSTNSLSDIIQDINSTLTEDIIIYANDKRLLVSKQ